MDEAMAPPTKRRKLSSSSGENIYRGNSTAQDLPRSKPQPRLELLEEIHGETTPDPPQLQHSPTPTEVVVRQELKRAAVGGIEHFQAVLPRQGTGAVSSVVPSANPSGVQTFTDAFTTLTYTPPALPSLPTLPSVPGATTFSSISSIPSTQSSSSPTISSSTSNNSSSFSSANGTSTTTTSSSLTTSAIILIGGNGTTTSKTTLTSTRSSTSTLYYATLGDGDISTITQSSTAFTTTVHGEVFTIPGYFDTQSRLGTSAKTTQSNSDSRASSTSSADVSAAGGTHVYGMPANTGSSGPTSTGVDGSNDDGGSNHSTTPPAGTIAGGVVGGAAGLAVLVLIAMLFVRWYRRKSQMVHQALSPGATGGPEERSRRGPGMAERAGIVPFAAAVTALFRHQNRVSEPEQPERGFARISGRKLPSQWSEGMTSSQPPNMPLTNTVSGDESERNISNSSYPREDHGYGSGGDLSPGAASPESMTQGPLRTSDPVMMSPGPERQPQVHYAGSHNLSRPGQAGMLSTMPPGTTNAYGRSETPTYVDPSRGSRFTEDM